MTENNLSTWERFEDIDPKFTKPITGKQYKGTSPNAHYIIKCLTELFGPVGQGFGWRVVAEDFREFGDGKVIHWCRIEFWHTDRANTFESYGQTQMAYHTNGGKYMVDEDAPKKSLTDAITKAAAQIGIGANIFMGRWDDNRYVQGVAEAYEQKGNPELAWLKEMLGKAVDADGVNHLLGKAKEIGTKEAKGMLHARATELGLVFKGGQYIKGEQQ